MMDYTFLSQIDLAHRCYLPEALYWRAFGRVPEELRDDYGNPWRDSDGAFEDFSVPWPMPDALSDGECHFAGLPVDPRWQALLTDRPNLDLDHYRRMIRLSEQIAERDGEQEGPYSVATAKSELAEAEKYHAEVAEWLPAFTDYLDEFKAEMCLDLKRGSLTAWGRKLPHPNLETSENMLPDNYTFADFEHTAVPQEAWLTRDVQWDNGMVLGRNNSFFWIQLNVADLLSRYPPSSTIAAKDLTPVGGSYVLSCGVPPGNTLGRSKGRPSLPWEGFHVEVARLYRSGEMPEKKEAAIALLQEWFQHTHQKSASRSAIGHKLKPYFDALGKK